jgi:hypothetical protein
MSPDDPSVFSGTGGLQPEQTRTNAGTNNYRIGTARNDPKTVSGNDRKALESCAFSDPLVAVRAVSVSLAVKRFVGSSPIASTRKVLV